MGRFMQALVNTVRGLIKAIARFPLTVLCLLVATGLTCYMISLHKAPDLIIQKLMFTFVLGAFLGVAAQFKCERFEVLDRFRVAVYVLGALLIGGYYLIILPSPAIDYGVAARTMVAVFAMFCAFIWVPSSWGKADFNTVALVHFKSAFTSILYSGVLAAGCASIIAAIDILLFKINSDVYGYMMAIIWILFATIYYLSLLPQFNSDGEAERAYTLEASHYPRFLEILVSYIAVPLVTAYTLVLLAYFVKIGINMKWPAGQLGPMILTYSAAGLIVYILASSLENHFARLYQRFFPMVLIPVVIMQLISVWIRISAYGFTESRYYVALFGIFSIAIGLLLSFKPVTRNGIIAILAAAFAIFSIIPPVDAFTISRNSQISRLEHILQADGILKDGTITPKTNVDMNTRLETTSILSYLERRSYLKSIAWIPNDFQTPRDMQKTLGFEPAYPFMGGTDNFFFANLDMQKPLDIGGYDILLQAGTYRGMDKSPSAAPSYDFKAKGANYQLFIERLSPQEARLVVKNVQGKELVSTGLYDFATSITGVSNRPKEMMDVDSMTLDAVQNGYKLRIIFQNINITYGTGADAGADYNFFVLFAAPPQ